MEGFMGVFEVHTLTFDSTNVDTLCTYSTNGLCFIF